MSSDPTSNASSSGATRPSSQTTTQAGQFVLPFVQQNADTIYRKLAKYPPGHEILVSKDFAVKHAATQTTQTAYPLTTDNNGKQANRPVTPQGHHLDKGKIKTIDPNIMFFVMPDGKQAVAVPNVATPATTYYENKVEQLRVPGQHEMVKWEKTSMTPQEQQYQYYYDNHQQTPGGGVQHQHQEVTNVVRAPPPPLPMPVAMHYQMEKNYAWNMAATNYNQTNLRAIQQNFHRQAHTHRQLAQPVQPQPARAPAAMPPTPQAQMEAILRRFEEMNQWMAKTDGASKQQKR